MTLPEQNIRGIKRKRQANKESKEDKEAQLRQKLHHSLRELRRVVKKAKTFEIQKTLKKLRDARRRGPDSDLARDLETQMEIFKGLDYDQLAHSALMTKLKKNKILSAVPLIQAISAELASNLVPSGTPGSPTAKVQSRILSCKILAAEVVSIVDSLRAFLDPSVGPEDIGDSTHKPPLSSNNSKRKSGIGYETSATSFERNSVNPSVQASNGEYEDTSDDEAIAVMDDGWESGTVSGPSESGDSVAGSAEGHNGMALGQDNGDSEDTFSEDPIGSKKSRPNGSKGQSEFLPSLSVGFTRGDSASEFSDSETRAPDGMKRNRRGQRARRAIWEKKFGKGANHIKKQQERSKRRRRGSIPADRRSGKGNSNSPSRPTPARSRAHPYDQEHARKVTLSASECNPGSTRRNGGSDLGGKEERPLHPSWEAKRKHKAASIVPSQGAKIVF